MEIEFFDVRQGDEAIGVGYKVGGVFQEYDPNEPGFVPMDRATAEARANEVRDRLCGLEPADEI